MKGFTRAAGLVATVTLAASGGWAQPVPDAAPSEPSSAVTTAPLAELDLWSVPARDGDRSGRPADLWRDVPAGLFQAVIPGLAPATSSPALRGLAVGALSAPGRAPVGADPALAGLRASVLLELGDPEAALALATRTPPASAPESLLRAGAEAALWLGEDARACAIEEQAAAGLTDPFWLRLRAFCRLTGEARRAAEVVFGLWRETGEEDPAFEALFGRALRDDGSAAAADVSTALNAALSRRLGSAPAGQADAPAPHVAARALSGDIEAAAHSLRRGVMALDAVRAAYMARDLPAEMAAPLVAASAEQPAPAVYDPALAPPGARGEAALYRLARQAPDPAQRLAALQRLLERAEGADAFLALSRLSAPEAASLAGRVEPGAAPAWLALAAAVGGRPEAARTLFSMALREQGGWSPARFALMQAVVAASDPSQGAAALDRLIELGAGGDRDAQGAAMLLAALGAEMTPDARMALAAFDVPRPRATPARLTALARAGVENRPGEAVLYALSVARQQPDALGLTERAVIVEALMRSGLADAARSVAIEGLMPLARP